MKNNNRDILVSIIIPAYNEADAIEKTVAEVKKLNLNKEIIIVDDGSKDNTVELAMKIDGVKLIQHRINRGRGAAIRTGIDNSNGEIICTQDADMEQLPSDILRLIKPILDEEADVVYGSRFRDPKNSATSTWLRILGNKFFAFLGNTLFHQHLTDVYTGSKCYSKKIFEHIRLESEGFEQEVEILAKLSQHKMRIAEIPIEYSFRTAGVSKMKFKDGIIGSYTILKYFLNAKGSKSYNRKHSS
jgi:glycosyltransferase involved in cell wall biosynthesis